MAAAMERENSDQVDSPVISAGAESPPTNGEDEQHAEMLISFQEITGLTDEDECRNKLQLHNWNLEMAVQSTFNENEGLPPVYQQQEDHDFQELPPQHPLPESLAQEILSHSTSSSRRSLVHIHRPQGWSDWLSRTFPFSVPYAIVSITYNFTYHVLYEFITFAVRIVWPGFARAQTEPIEDVRSFVSKFEESFGLVHPNFYQGSYREVLSKAKNDLKFLLVYLHSSQHEDTPMFCRTVMTNPGFVEYVNGSMLMWACDVSTNEGNRVSRAMKEMTYPFLAVACLRDNRMTIVWRAEGFVPVDHLISLLTQVVQQNEPSLVAAQADRNEQNLTRTLLNEQNEAFQASLAADQEKALKRKQEEEAIKQAELALKEKEDAKQKKIEDIAARRVNCRLIMESQQEVSSDNPNAIRIRIKLPNGETFQRHFLKSNLLQLLYDFVTARDDSPAEFLLSSSFPRRTFPLEENEGKTLEEVGIVTSTALFVQSTCDESSDEEDSS